MKNRTLNEILEDAFKNGPIPYKAHNSINILEDFSLRGEHLLNIENEIKNLDIFKEANLKIINLPSFVLNNKIYVSQTVKLEECTKIKGNCFLYAIQWTPEMFSSEEILDFKKDHKEKIRVGPTIYSEQDFKPYVNIILHIDAEELESNDAVFGKKNNPSREEYHNLLDEALENPDKFKTKGKRGVILRGVFENIETDKEHTFKTDLNIDIESKFLESFSVFFLDHYKVHKGEEQAVLELRLNSRTIPEILREEFLKKFDLKSLLKEPPYISLENIDNQKTKAEQIDDFLNEHKFQVVKYYSNNY